MNQDIKYKIIDALKAKGAYSVSVNGKQHYTRCPYCGDSRNLSHAHLSIKIDTLNDDPMVFRCLKCDARGLVTDTVLEELDIPVDQTLHNELKSYNKKAMKLGKLVNLDFEKYVSPTYCDSALNWRKLSYINDRLGTDIDMAQAHDLKLILNIFDFMTLNEMKTIPDMSFGMLKNINENYVGFLSTNNNCIVFRDITGKQKYRYFKTILNPKNVNQDTFYSIPNRLSLMYTNDVNIHLAEGTFDIISVFKNVIKSKENNYFYAMCGFGGISVMKYLLHHGINTGVNLHIYSDNDKSDWNHKKYLNNPSMSCWLDHVYIHRNQYVGEKDYGVPTTRIKDSNRKIK